jgi:peptide/nickel transport system substrate-binding protein
VLASDGSVKPFLAQSVTPSKDYATWTIKLRPGIQFHNGTALDAAAVKTNMEARLQSLLNSPALFAVDKVSVTDPMTVTVTTKGPWVTFNLYLAGGLGMMIEPNALMSGDANQNPIGTGPFVFKEWVPGDHMTVTKNPKYWRSGLPYLDSITFRPIIEPQSRTNSLKAGQIDMFHSSDPTNIHDFQGSSDFVVVTDLDRLVPGGEPDQIFLLLNTAVAPLDDLRVRQAMAYAIDTTAIRNTLGFGITPPSDGPFIPGTDLYTPTGYPSTPDTAKAKSLIDSYKAEKGDVRIDLGTTNVGRNLQLMELIQGMLAPVGITTTITQVQQSSLINNAVYGNFQAYLWRQYASVTPDTNYVFWTSATSGPVGSPALNFARYKDPQIDAALAKGRTIADVTERNKVYKEIGVRMGAIVPYIWLNRCVWAVVHKPSVGGLATPSLPDGGNAFSFGAGVFWPAALWTAA